MNNTTTSLQFYLYLLLCLSLNTSCMEVNEHHNQPFPIKIITHIARQSDLPTTNALLCSCKEYNKAYSKEATSKTRPLVLENFIATLQTHKNLESGLERFLLHNEETMLCSLNNYDYFSIALRCAQTKNFLLYNSLQAYCRSNEHYCSRIKILRFFGYDYLDERSAACHFEAYCGIPKTYENNDHFTIITKAIASKDINIMRIVCNATATDNNDIPTPK